MAGNRRIQWLVLVHIILGLLFGSVAAIKIEGLFGLQEILIVPFHAVAFGQVSLLTFWMVFSSGAWWKRLGGLATGVACLDSFFYKNWGGLFFLMPSLAMLIAAGALLVTRAFGVRFRHVSEDIRLSPREPVRFQLSIRGIMLFTLVVAMLCGMVRSPRGTIVDFGPELTFTWSLCFAVVGVLSLRVALSLVHRPGRGLLLLALSLGLGAFMAYTVEASWEGWFYLFAIMLLYPAILLVSLRVVRSCGYRLVRSSASGPGQVQTVAGAP